MTGVEALLGATGVRDRRGSRSPSPRSSALIAEGAGPATPWWALLTVAVVVEQAAFIASWWVLGAAVLDDGGITPDRAAAWAGILMLSAGSAVTATWAAARAGVAIGVGVRRRLLRTVLTVDPDAVRRRGSGRLLGTVSEAAVLETATVAGALACATGAAFIVGAAAVLIAAWTPAVLVVVAAWSAVTALVAVALVGTRRLWHDERQATTESLVERLLGHRSVQVQGDPAALALQDASGLGRYDGVSRRSDRLTLLLHTAVPRVGLAAGVAVLVASLGELPTGRAVATFGALLLLAQAAGTAGRGFVDLLDARLAAIDVRELTSLPAAPVPPRTTEVRGDPVEPGPGTEGIHARAVHCSRGPGADVLRDVDLDVRPGRRVVLTGRSGAGKTTLAQVLTGLRPPTSGQVAVSADVGLVPQFDDNHLLLGTLAYNLLLGASWPPEDEAFDRAEQLCRDLGLGDLLDRMPSGIFENVGETGWQLSHGERARVFLARALLNGPGVVVIDETFGALDPASHRAALETATAWSRATLLIAHP